jgi:hypothetical protein
VDGFSAAATKIEVNLDSGGPDDGGQHDVKKDLKSRGLFKNLGSLNSKAAMTGEQPVELINKPRSGTETTLSFKKGCKSHRNTEKVRGFPSAQDHSIMSNPSSQNPEVELVRATKPQGIVKLPKGN